MGGSDDGSEELDGNPCGSLGCACGMQRSILSAVTIVILACLAGCKTPDRPHPDAEPLEARIAKHYLQETLGVKSMLEVGPVTKFDDFTSVWIWYLPQGPGRFNIVNVGEDGRVIEVIPGR